MICNSNVIYRLKHTHTHTHQKGTVKFSWSLKDDLNPKPSGAIPGRGEESGSGQTIKEAKSARPTWDHKGEVYEVPTKPEFDTVMKNFGDDLIVVDFTGTNSQMSVCSNFGTWCSDYTRARTCEKSALFVL